MSHRFFLESETADPIAIGTELTLEGDQAHHAIHVMRFQPGDSFVLFNGRGTEYKADVVSVAKKRIVVAVVQAEQIPRSLATQITIAVALPKGDRQKFLVEKLVELGVARLVPLKTSRSVAAANPKVIQRLKKQVIEASKQCGRNWLMEVAEEQTLKQLAEMLDTKIATDSQVSDSQAADSHVSGDAGPKRLIADPYQGKSIAAIASSMSANSVVIAIGPEGGFDDAENALAHELGFEPVTLGPSILRIETAALTAAAIFGIGNES